MKVLVASVGGSPEGQAKAIQELGPDKVVFLVSQASVENVAAIKRLCSGLTFRDRKVMVDDESDLPNCYSRAREALRWAVREAESLEDVWFDFTGGTKVMSAALVLAGGEVGARPVYVGGAERNKGGLGTVVTGTEEVITQANPWDAFAVPQQRRAALLFNQGRIEAARETMAGVCDTARSARLAEYASIAVEVMGFYVAWDAFRHGEAFAGLRGSRALERLEAFATGAQDAGLRRLAESVAEGAGFIKELLDKSGGGKHPTRHRLRDILANADRRATEGRWDDAVARLYRAVELGAEVGLWQGYGIRTDSVDVARVPAEKRPAVEQLLGSPPWSNLGLARSYALLEALGGPLGVRFLSVKEDFDKRLHARNHSILAHGLNPVAESTFRELRALVLDLTELSEADLPRFPGWPEELGWQR